VREITTGQLVHWRETQGGHYISASVNITCFELNNVWPQFPGSNKIMSMGDQKAQAEKDKYRTELIKRIGLEKVNNLEQLAVISKK
jgi:bacteriophage lambda ninG protein